MPQSYVCPQEGIVNLIKPSILIPEALYNLASKKNHKNFMAKLMRQNREADYLLTFDRPVYMPNEKQWGMETHCPKHKKEAIADASHVAKEERGLHKTRHIRSCIIIIQAICIDKHTSRSTTKERSAINQNTKSVQRLHRSKNVRSFFPV